MGESLGRTRAWRYSYSLGLPTDTADSPHTMTCRLLLRRNFFTFIASVWLWAMLGAAAAQPLPEVFAGRTAYIYTPANLPSFGSRALVVLHGGLGNAERLATARIERALNMNAVADQGGFVVAYLSGTPVARMLGPYKLGWNAGACCGRVDFASQAAMAKVWQYSGALYDLRIIEGADHSVQSISRKLLITESHNLAQTMARFLGLLER